MQELSADDLSASKTKVAREFQGLIAGAQDLLRSTANASGDQVDAARKNLGKYLDQARGALADIEDLALDQYDRASESTDRYVRSNPWQAVGMAAAAGILLGFLATRR